MGKDREEAVFYVWVDEEVEQGKGLEDFFRGIMRIGHPPFILDEKSLKRASKMDP